MNEPFGKILLRTPLLSLEEAYSLREDNLSDLFLEGIFLSSSEFYRAFLQKTTLSEREEEKLHLTLIKYHLRSCSRCTPFGTLAGCTLIDINDEPTDIILSDPTKHIRRIRVDMNYISEIINALQKDSSVRNQILYYTNKSIYELPDSFRYVEYTIKRNLRHYTLTSIRKNTYIHIVLNAAKSGATLSELNRVLVKAAAVEKTEAAQFIEEMCDSQLLVSELEPCITGNEPLDNLIGQLDKLQGVSNLTEKLKKILYLTRNPSIGINCYKEIENHLIQLNINVQIPQNTIQTDLYLNTDKKNIDRSIIDTIIKQVDELAVFCRVRKNTALETFKTNFLEKYNEEEVELSIALDGEVGIGYAGLHQTSSGVSNILDDLLTRVSDDEAIIQFNSLQQFALMKYKQYLEADENCIIIKEKDLREFRRSPENYRNPRTSYILGNLMKHESKPDDFIFDLFGMDGPCGAKLLTRFAHGDENIHKLAKEIFQEDKNEVPDGICAEVAHVPQARISNVLLRPNISDYEIPYVGKSGIEEKHQISVRDIMISVRNNEIILRSRKLKKRIFPRLTTAHNFSNNSLPLYKFLGDVQYQGFGTMTFWDWGPIPFTRLPRVIYKNLILKKAIWIINDLDLVDLPNEKEAYISYFDSFRTRLKMPERVVLVDHDHKLLIDFRNLSGILLFIGYLRREKNLVVEEFLFTEQNCVVKDEKGRPYINEMIIPLKDKKVIRSCPVIEPTQSERVVKQKFNLGSEWLYFKIYCGSLNAEHILQNTIKNFISKKANKVLFEKFFFIRYNDPSHHIRIRFYNSNLDNQSILQQAFIKRLQPLLDSGVVDKVVMDTYSRELVRYGSETIVESESLFYNDSVTVLNFISLLLNQENEDYKLIFALRGVEALLDDFKFSLEQKKGMLKYLYLNFYKEFGGNALLQKQLNDKYRERQQFIFPYLNKNLDGNEGITRIVKLLQKRSILNKKHITAILLQFQNDSDKLSHLIGSHLHMFINRLFASNQRKYELLIYHFLERYFSSVLAQHQRHKNNLN